MRYLLLVLTILASCVIESSLAATYRFRTGDVIQISVWQEPKLDRQVVVAPDGAISLPLVGRIEAGGRSSDQIAQVIKSRLAKNYQGELDVSVAFVAKPPPVDVNNPTADPVVPSIYVMGEVKQPGQFAIRTRTTVLQALGLSGGLSPFAADQRITVHRKVKGADIVHDFNYDEFMAGTDVSGNIYLRSGDVIVVPERGLFE